MKNLLRVFVVLTAVMVVALSVDAGDRPRVVATYSILGEWVAEVGGTNIILSVIVGRDGDSHTYSPTPADAVAIAQADLVLENGLGFEPWLTRLIESSGTKARRAAVSQGIESLRANLEAGHGMDVNPHVWHDVRLAIQMVQEVARQLALIDPPHAAEYRQRSERYCAELQELDLWVVQQTQSLPAARRKLVTSHDTFGYFARRYGFEVVGTALGSFTTDTPDPAAIELAQLVEKIKAAGVPVVFTENMVNPKVLERVAHEAHVRVAPTLFTDALGPVGSEGETYLKLMHYNVRTMVEALKK